jgi:WD40 repeat protein
MERENLSWFKIYKERTKRWHDKRIKKKKFAPKDKVLLFNSRVRLFGHGKLQTKGEGPFMVVSTLSHEAVTLQNNEGMLFNINGHCLQIFLQPDKPLEVVDELDFIIR